MLVGIAVAGMYAALPGVLVGPMPGLVIAVLISTGFGVATQGHADLNAALARCAPGLAAVNKNIENGSGSARAALCAVRGFKGGGDGR